MLRDAGSNEAIETSIRLRDAMRKIETSAGGFHRLALNARIVAHGRPDVAGLDEVAVELGNFAEEVLVAMRGVSGSIEHLVRAAGHALVADANVRRAPTGATEAATAVRRRIEHTRTGALGAIGDERERLARQLAASDRLRRHGFAVATTASVITAGSHDHRVDAVVDEFGHAVEELNDSLQQLHQIARVKGGKP